MIEDKIKAAVRDVPDFPSPGILFKDISPLFQDPDLCREIIQALAEPWKNSGINVVAGVESRGFLFGPQLALALNASFIPVRKKGKLPYETHSLAYDLEYGQAEIEMHTDAISKGDKVLVHDDLLATGGTAAAASDLISIAGGEICGFSFLIELSFLNGTPKLKERCRNISILARW